MSIEPRINDMSDDDIFEETCLDEKAFQILFKEYFAILCTYCQLKYSFDAELSREAVHSGFIKLWENRNAIIPGKSIKSYLYKIVSNTCVDIIRQRSLKKRQEKHIRENFDETDFYDLHHLDTKALEQAIDISVSELPEKMRIIFRMSRYEGWKYSQIAEHLNISVNTVETQMSRALAKLRVKLSEFYLLGPLIFHFFKNYF